MVHSPEDYNWSQDVLSVFKKKQVTHVATVPDGGLAPLLTLCEDENDIDVTTLTTEEEGVALCSGLWLGGKRSALLIQSSGVGNCINMLSLPITCRIPFLMIVTMRGEWGEFNPWQAPMGRGTPDVLTTMGLNIYRPDTADRIGDTLSSVVDNIFATGESAALLISQKIIGAKNFLNKE